MSEIDVTITRVAGTATNPMLAFGRGEEGRVCGECEHYVHGYSACLKRVGKGCVKRARPHRSDWPACKYFKLSETGARYSQAMKGKA